MKGKEQWETDNQKLCDFAGSALQGILAGIHGNPMMLETFKELAEADKISVNMFLAKRSFEIALMMMKEKEKHELGKPIKQ